MRCQTDGLTYSDKKMRDRKKPRETLRNLSSRNLNIFWVVLTQMTQRTLTGRGAC
jgi:hypothetical protein